MGKRDKMNRYKITFYWESKHIPKREGEVCSEKRAGSASAARISVDKWQTQKGRGAFRKSDTKSWKIAAI